MSAPRIPASPRAATVRAFLTGLALLVLLAGCSGTGGTTAAKLLHYQRVWPDGTIEQQTIYADGRIEMKHGETLERITISSSDVARIQDALTQPIPTGAPTDSPKRTLTLPDGTQIDAPRPDPGTVTELLERLLDTHSIG